MKFVDFHPEPEQITQYQSKLIDWGRNNFRSFPWRETRNPYQLLIAETLLHRTQARQVVAVYLNFLELYPDVPTLAEASQEEIEMTLRSLGLFWRIELIIEMAYILNTEFKGHVPIQKEKLMNLPGVGDYISSSVRCFAFGLPDAIVDTNVMRVITRMYGIPFRDSLRRNKYFLKLAQDLVDPNQPREYNFALLDLANLVCKPKDPTCKKCPVHFSCVYFKDLFDAG